MDSNSSDKAILQGALSRAQRRSTPHTNLEDRDTIKQALYSLTGESKIQDALDVVGKWKVSHRAMLDLSQAFEYYGVRRPPQTKQRKVSHVTCDMCGIDYSKCYQFIVMDGVCATCRIHRNMKLKTKDKTGKVVSLDTVEELCQLHEKPLVPIKGMQIAKRSYWDFR